MTTASSRFVNKVPVPLPTPEEIGCFIKNEIERKLERNPAIRVDSELRAEMEQQCITLGNLSQALSYRDLSAALSRFFADRILRNISIISKNEIMRCIEAATQSTPMAVIHQSQHMANNNNNNRRFFQSASNTSLSASPATPNASSGFSAM